MLLLAILFLWSFAIPATAPEMLATPDQTTVAQKAAAPLKAKKTLDLFATLHTKLCAASKKSGIRFHKPKTYQNLRNRITALCSQPELNSDAALAALETYLENMCELKTDVLFATSPEVIHLTKTALQELRKRSSIEQKIVQNTGEIILLIKNQYLPKKPLCAAFGLKEVGYSVAVASVAWAGTRWIASGRRSSISTNDESSPKKILLQETSSIDNLTIDFVQLDSPRQGSLGCTQHTSSNIFQILRQLDTTDHGLSTPFEEKKAFINRTNFLFKSEDEVTKEIADFNKKKALKLNMVQRLSGTSIKYGSLENTPLIPVLFATMS